MKQIRHYMLPLLTEKLYEKEAISSIALTKEVANKINELVEAYNSLYSERLTKYQEQDGKIQKGILYMKDNLANTLYDMFNVMKNNGEFESIINDSVNTRINSSYYKTLGFNSIMEYGAYGDGINDDTAAIERAINSGKAIYFPKGVYIITRAINITNKDNLMFYDGDATFKNISTDFTFVINGLRDSNIEIGSLIAETGSGIKFICNTDNNYSQYINLSFKSIICSNYGIYADITKGWINEVVLNGGYLRCNCGVHLSANATEETTAWKFKNVSFEGSKTGLYLGGTGSRFRAIELDNIRYGDDSSMVVLNIETTIHNLRFNSQFPFYDKYLVIGSKGNLFYSELNVPYYNSYHQLVTREIYYGSDGRPDYVGYITKTTQDSFNDCKHLTVTPSTKVTVNNSYCASNNIVATYCGKITCNSGVNAWETILTLPLENCRVTGGGIWVYVPNMNKFIYLYLNSDGTVVPEEAITSGSVFVLNFTAIKNQK